MGTADPADVEAWLKKVEKYFRPRSMSNVEETWEEFEKAFKDKWYSKHYYDAKRNEFMRLVQGSKGVAEYKKRIKQRALTQIVSLPKPTVNGESSSGAKQKGHVRRLRQQGKLYAMTQQEVEDAPKVVTGMNFLSKYHASMDYF
ncbi:putative ABC transporter C family member 15 [Cucumis melo var. makuwa]|uniref:ABC transporter C family member 15 n=1 Tax=Cucumis melo var. makuwa TaxID=1194695 RepID=A0A5D3DFH5_CUCMM|nr:putative ABC transporter C family member 15 [Cucumis melo var. makuwa]TYK22451.1 putative ABC transporter C family member 15 [Cucumis melo var. makuwa]